jgi:hypothetical protein
LRIQITKPGDVERGILDYGTIESQEGAHFEGFIGAVRESDENLIQIVPDSGKLKLPDGRVFTGEFTMGLKEGKAYTYYEILPGL